MFRDHPEVNEARSGGAVEVCLALLCCATSYPYEFKLWEDPYEHYASVECSLRVFAAMTGYLNMSKTQRGALRADLSPEVPVVAESFALVLGSPTIMIILDDYNKALKLMKKSPITAPIDVKMEPGDDATHAAPVVDVQAADENAEVPAEAEDVLAAELTIPEGTLEG